MNSTKVIFLFPSIEKKCHKEQFKANTANIRHLKTVGDLQTGLLKICGPISNPSNCFRFILFKPVSYFLKSRGGEEKENPTATPYTHPYPQIAREGPVIEAVPADLLGPVRSSSTTLQPQ